MPLRQKLDVIQRFAVWRAHESRCFWCHEPLAFLDCQIDHVIPLKAVSKDNLSLEKIIELYDLPKDFEINGFQNCVPSHGRCNRIKSTILLEPSPAFVLSFKIVLMKARIAEAVAKALENDNRKAEVVVRIFHATNSGLVTKEEIIELFNRLPVMLRRSAFEYEEHLILSPEWTVIVRGYDLEVRKGGA